MTPSEMIAPHLPYLRRYARALTGSQRSGDAFVAATLRALIASTESLDPDLGPRAALYRVFHAIWSSGYIEPGPVEETGLAARAQERLQSLTPRSRQALLLTTVEGFSDTEAAQIFAAPLTVIRELVAEARAEIARQTTARILIIEDETLIAMDLNEIVTTLGHTVIATADTAAKAIAAAAKHKPDLVLTDIQLADGSSGVMRVVNRTSPRCGVSVNG